MGYLPSRFPPILPRNSNHVFNSFGRFFQGLVFLWENPRQEFRVAFYIQFFCQLGMYVSACLPQALSDLWVHFLERQTAAAAPRPSLMEGISSDQCAQRPSSGVCGPSDDIISLEQLRTTEPSSHVCAVNALCVCV